MSKLNFAPHLFLGLAELEFFRKSIQDNGYKSLLSEAILSYGVSLTNSPSSWKVIAGSGPLDLSLLFGTAIDSNLNSISTPVDLIDELTVSSTTGTYYIYLSHDFSVEEEGLVSVSSSGVVSGLGTKFTERLRSAPDQASIIEFSTGPNTGRYPVQQVTSDTSLQLNVPVGVLTSYLSTKYKVVGTFTPGITATGVQKYPFQNDSYLLDIRTTTAGAVEGLEFLLAEVEVAGGIITSIIDRRIDDLFVLNSTQPTEVVTETSTNRHCSLFSVQYDQPRSDRNKSIAYLGWGFLSNSGDWSWDTALNTITISVGVSPGVPNVAGLTSGEFDDWMVYIENDKLSLPIISSTLVNPTTYNIVVNYTGSLTGLGKIIILPNCDFIQFKVEDTATPAPNRLAFSPVPVSEFSTTFEVPAGVAGLKISFRHIRGNIISSWEPIVNTTFLRESSFDDNGNLIAPITSTSVAGVITTLLNPINFYDKKAWLHIANTFTAKNTFSADAQFEGNFLFTGASALLNSNSTTFVLPTSTVIDIIPTATNLHIGGFVPTGGIRLVYIRNSGATTFYLRIKDSAAAGANQITLGNVTADTDVPLFVDSECCLIYQSGKWNLMGVNAPQWKQINPAITISGGVVPSVIGLAVNNLSYKLDPLTRSMNIIWDVHIPMNSGEDIETLIISIPEAQTTLTNSGFNFYGLVKASAIGSHTTKVFRPCNCLVGGAFITIFGGNNSNSFDNNVWSRDTSTLDIRVSFSIEIAIA